MSISKLPNNQVLVDSPFAPAQPPFKALLKVALDTLLFDG